MKYRITLLAVILAIATTVFGQNKSSPARIKGDNDPVARESDVQTRVSGEMTHLVQEFGELVNDIESNQAFKQAEGGALDGMKKSLRSTDKNRVRVAASELRKAIDNSASRGTHVKKAAVQVNHAKTELTDLLRQANGLMLADTIGAEIRGLILDEQDLAKKTAQAAREQLQQLPLSSDPAQLAKEQRQIAKRVKKLTENIKEALKEELTEKDSEKLQKALKTAEEKQLEPKVQKAVDDLDQGNLPEAFKAEQEAIEALTKMGEEISDVEPPASEADVERMKSELAAQTELRKKTESMSPQDFKQKAPELQLEQLNLANELPPSSEATLKMENAAGELEKMEQAAAVAEQMAAEAALGAAIEDAMGPGPGVPGAKGEAGTDDKGDGDSEKDEEGRGNEGKGKKGKGKKAGPPKPDSEPDGKAEPNDNPPDQNAEIEPALAKNMPTRSNVEPKDGERKFEKSKVEGRLPQGSDSTWTSLSRKERNSLSENFAREMPREYRDMLKVYFEELSK